VRHFPRRQEPSRPKTNKTTENHRKMRRIWSFCKVHGYLHLNPSIIHANIRSQTLQDNFTIFLFLDSSSKYECIGLTPTPCRQISALPRHHISPPTKGGFHHPTTRPQGVESDRNGQIICDYPSMLIFQSRQLPNQQPCT
jgi:hypothetical protein